MRRTLALLALLAGCGRGDGKIPDNGDLPNVGLGRLVLFDEPF